MLLYKPFKLYPDPDWLCPGDTEHLSSPPLLFLPHAAISLGSWPQLFPSSTALSKALT